MTEREHVYAAIDSERNYQEALRQASTAFPGGHEIPAYLLFMDDYMRVAKHVNSTDWSPECAVRTLDIIRKVVALGVACMEEHGAPFRVMPAPQQLQDRVS